MDFNCPSCNKSGNIDDAKLSESSVYATCPQCKSKFLINPEASKDFVYETVTQAEPQQASLKASAASTQSAGGTYIPTDTAEHQKFSILSEKANISRISTRPLEFFFALLFVSAVRLIGNVIGAIGVAFFALCGILLGWQVGKFVGHKLNDSKLQRTHKIITAWAVCLASFITFVVLSLAIEGPQQYTADPNSSPPARTPSQPEYSQGFRFDETVVTDLRTGLMWTRDANVAGKQMNWFEARKWVKSLSVGGYHDWRLPTENELMTMKKYFAYGPADSLNRLGFTNVQKTENYWSSTKGKDQFKSYATTVYMRFGYTEEEAQVADHPKTAFVGNALANMYDGISCVWPVRDGR